MRRKGTPLRIKAKEKSEEEWSPIEILRKDVQTRPHQPAQNEEGCLGGKNFSPICISYGENDSFSNDDSTPAYTPDKLASITDYDDDLDSMWTEEDFSCLPRGYRTSNSSKDSAATQERMVRLNSTLLNSCAKDMWEVPEPSLSAISDVDESMFPSMSFSDCSSKAPESNKDMSAGRRKFASDTYSPSIEHKRYQRTPPPRLLPLDSDNLSSSSTATSTSNAGSSRRNTTGKGKSAAVKSSASNRKKSKDSGPKKQSTGREVCSSVNTTKNIIPMKLFSPNALQSCPSSQGQTSLEASSSSRNTTRSKKSVSFSADLESTSFISPRKKPGRPKSKANLQSQLCKTEEDIPICILTTLGEDEDVPISTSRLVCRSPINEQVRQMQLNAPEDILTLL